MEHTWIEALKNSLIVLGLLAVMFPFVMMLGVWYMKQLFPEYFEDPWHVLHQ